MCVFVCLQEAGPLHSAPHSSIWYPLHGVRLLPGEREQEGASGLRAGPGLLPGADSTGTCFEMLFHLEGRCFQPKIITGFLLEG